MVWLKSLHIIFVVCWFAGLFYLPRIFVNLAMLEPGDTATRERLLLMARKLYRFVTPFALLSVIFGVWLWMEFQFRGGWLHAKTALVVLLLGYHHGCGRLLKKFENNQNTRSHVWFRVFNEVPVVILVAIVFLVVGKPF